jgi:hypothetical protein
MLGWRYIGLIEALLRALQRLKQQLDLTQGEGRSAREWIVELIPVVTLPDEEVAWHSNAHETDPTAPAKLNTKNAQCDG